MGIKSLFQQIWTRNTKRPNVYALQRSEILDEDICDFCLSVDGRIVSTDDDIAKIDSFHNGCRGIWVEIMDDEAELPPIKGVPDKLRELLKGDPENLLKMDKPILDKGSLAWDYYNGELDLTGEK